MTNDKQTDRPSPRMPVRRNGLATKARLIDAAITLIGAGEDNLTMRSLSAEASCSPAAVYQFFSDMNHVLESVSEVIVEEVTTYLGKRLTPTLALQDPILFFFELIRCVEVLQRKRPATMCLAKPAATQASQMLALSLRTAVFELVCDAFQTAYPHVDRGNWCANLQRCRNAWC